MIRSDDPNSLPDSVSNHSDSEHDDILCRCGNVVCDRCNVSVRLLGVIYTASLSLNCP